MLDTPFVFRHPGLLCRAIREIRTLMGIGRELTTREMAQKCHVAQRYVQQFEDGERLFSGDLLLAYIGALGLPVRDALRLLMLCRSYRERVEYEEILHHCHFDFILDNPRLRTAVEELRHLSYPALLLDPLSYVLAMNDLYLRLFNLDMGALLNPYMWHLVSAEFAPGSPVCRAQLPPRAPYLIHLIHLFNKSMVPCYFTQQNLSLQESLLFLSPGEYGKAWSAWALMLQIDYDEEPARILRYKQQVSHWRICLYPPTMVPVSKHYILPYRLLALVPDSQDARDALEDMQTHLQHSLVFARDYGVSEMKLPLGL